MKNLFHRLSAWFLNLWRHFRKSSIYKKLHLYLAKKAVEQVAERVSSVAEKLHLKPKKKIDYSSYSLTPKAYGEYMLRSGLWRRNRLK